ncbi:MAG: phage holin family protein [Solirubrobacteraceae bacterium]
MAPEPTPSPSELGRALQQVTDLSQKIIHEEIELAKAEVSMKVAKLAKGAAVGAAAGVFVLFGFIMVLNSLAWLLWQFVGGETSFWLGFALVALFLFILAGVAGFLAFKFVKGGAPPTPQMAIDEAQKVKATITAGSKS